MKKTMLTILCAVLLIGTAAQAAMFTYVDLGPQAPGKRPSISPSADIGSGYVATSENGDDKAYRYDLADMSKTALGSTGYGLPAQPYVSDAGYVSGYDGGRSWSWDAAGNPSEVPIFQLALFDANNSKSVLKKGSGNATMSMAWNAGGTTTANPVAPGSLDVISIGQGTNHMVGIETTYSTSWLYDAGTGTWGGALAIDQAWDVNSSKLIAGAHGGVPVVHDLVGGVTTPIPLLPGKTGGRGHSMNDAGQVVGYQWGDFETMFYWDSVTGTLDLNSAANVANLPGGDYLGGGFSFQAISQNGLIVGRTSNNRAFLLIPEPATLALLASAGLFLLGRRR